MGKILGLALELGQAPLVCHNFSVGYVKVGVVSGMVVLFVLGVRRVLAVCLRRGVVRVAVTGGVGV
jgi:uncharacterized YccA/Bax inhibitor family protein